MRQGLAALHAAGREIGQAVFHALMPEAYGRMGQADEGLSIVGEALTRAHKQGARLDEAECYRFKGELLLVREAGGDVSGSPPPELSMIDRGFRHSGPA